MVSELVRQQAGSAVPADPIDEEKLRRIVRTALAEQLAALPDTPLLDGHSLDPAETARLVQWLAPTVQALIMESLRAGLALRSGSAPGPSREPLPRQAPAWSPVLQDERAAGGAGESTRPSAHEPFIAPVLPGMAAPARAYPAAAPIEADPLALATGQITLIAGPFEKFTQVRAFLDDVARVPRILDVRPKTFVGGQLVATLQSEYTDTQTLVDRLTTDLAPYRIIVRSVQTGAIELLVRQAVR